MKKILITTLLSVLLVGCSNPDSSLTSANGQYSTSNVDNTSLNDGTTPSDSSNPSNSQPIDYDMSSLIKYVDKDDLVKNIDYLTSPKLAGRSPGTEGNDLALAYANKIFEDADLLPFNNSYYLPYNQEYVKIATKYHTLYTYNPNNINDKTVYEYSFDYSFDLGYGYSYPSNKVDLDLDLNSALSSIFKYQKSVVFPTLEYGQGSYFDNSTNNVGFNISKNMQNSLNNDLNNGRSKVVINYEYDTSRNVEINNLGGYLQGGKAVDDKYYVIGAHIDHLGRYGEGENQYFPGALDNASGSASLLSLVKGLSSVKEQLDFNVLFLLYNGEEAGLYGSYAYVKNPVLPLNKIISHINYDMVGSNMDNDARLEIYGALTSTARSNLISSLKESSVTNYSFGGNQANSDHAGFASKNIVSFSLVHFDDRYYHTPLDTKEHLDYDVMLRHIDVGLKYIEKM